MERDKKKSWGDIPSLEGLGMDWEYKPESAGNKRSAARVGTEALAALFGTQEILLKVVAGGQTSSARLLDLCEGGLSMSIAVPLAERLAIKIGFFLGQTKVITGAEVRQVRQVGDRYITGVKFVGLDPKTAEFIRGLYASGVLRHSL